VAETIFWDFDGVLMDSMPIRNKGFELVLASFPEDQVAQLMDFHLKNGGLSRYVKFRYFFENIRNERISERQVFEYAGRFSEIMLEKLADKRLFIEDSISFVKQNFKKYSMHIVSGSDQTELRQICSELSLDQYFLSINGSPANKKEILNSLFADYQLKKGDCIFIGDSVNDFEAAKAFDLLFIGYNNLSLKPISDRYLNSFREF